MINSIQLVRHHRVRRTVVVVAASALAAGAAFASTAPEADAATRYVIKTDVAKPEPPCKGPGGSTHVGSWLANKPCGYVLGWAMAGSKFDVVRYSPTKFGFGRSSVPKGSFCAWVSPKAFKGAGKHVASSCSSTVQKRIKHRLTFGRDFAAPAKTKKSSARTIDVNLNSCRGFRNYFTSSSFKGGKFQNATGKITEPAKYRYSSRDRRAAMVEVTGPGRYGKNSTWLFVPRSCIQSQLKSHHLYNDND